MSMCLGWCLCVPRTHTRRHEYMLDSHYGLTIGLGSLVIYKAVNPPSSGLFLTQPQGWTCSWAITQQQMVRNLPSVSRQITHTLRTAATVRPHLHLLPLEEVPMVCLFVRRSMSAWSPITDLNLCIVCSNEFCLSVCFFIDQTWKYLPCLVDEWGGSGHFLQKAPIWPLWSFFLVMFWLRCQEWKCLHLYFWF